MVCLFYLLDPAGWFDRSIKKEAYCGVEHIPDSSKDTKVSNYSRYLTLKSMKACMRIKIFLFHLVVQL